MAIGPFLTELDGRAIIKGSRDPLGVQQIWTRLGRRVIGNLTTVSNSLRDFTTLMIGLYLAEALSEAGQKNAGLPAFLRWEQLAGYARGHVNSDWGFRGTERVKANLVSSNTQTLSVKGKGPILSDQKTYGLWGLYTVPARLSGLVDADVSRLTPVARDFVERHYVPKLSLQGQGLKPLLALIQKDPAAIRVDHPLVAAVGNALSQKKLSKSEIAFYREYLIEGGPNDATHGIQTLLERAMIDTLPRNDFRWGPDEVRQIAQRADKLGEQGEDLVQRLQQILDCEAVIAPISRLFTHLLAKHGVQVDEVAAQIRQAWGKSATTIDAGAFSALRPYLPTTELGSADQWIRIASLAETGDYAALVTEMVAMNRSVMAARGGAAWVQISDGALQVSFQEEQGRMPAGEELRTQWRHPYFLDSLRAMAIPLRER